MFFRQTSCKHPAAMDDDPIFLYSCPPGMLMPIQKLLQVELHNPKQRTD
jgi:hypothetical protein